MSANILIIDDDCNFSDIIIECLMTLDSKLFVVHAVRTIEDGQKWLEDETKSASIKVCILDLMFPPKLGEVVGDVTDLAQGLRFYQQYLKGKIRTVILTGALRSFFVEKQVREIVDGDSYTRVIKKPVDLEYLVELIREDLADSKKLSK